MRGGTILPEHHFPPRTDPRKRGARARWGAGRHGIVLVDHGHRPHGQQGIEGGGRVQAQGPSRRGSQRQGNGPEGGRDHQLDRSPDPGRRRPCGDPPRLVLLELPHRGPIRDCCRVGPHHCGPWGAARVHNGGGSPWPPPRASWTGRLCPQRRWGTHPAGRLPGGVEGWDRLRWISTPTRSTKARCHGTSTARGLYLSRTKATALSGLTPSRTARMARPVPVLPTPPPHPISTRSPAALSHASVRAATASDPELGTQKSRHRTQRESHGAFAGSRAARYTPNSGSGPSGTPARSPRPRTLRPDGNATTPGAVDSHASLNAVLLFSASRGPRRVEEADRCARILAPLGLVTPSTWTG